MDLIKTKDNNFTINIDGVFIHSKYSPITEAERFIDNNLNETKTVIVIGAGLGYIFSAISKKNPRIKIVSIPLNEEMGHLSINLIKSERIQWDFKEDLKSFISRNINIENISGLQILEWAPTKKIYSELSMNINKLIVSRVRRVNGNILTTARFGKLWIKNSIKNYLKIKNYISSLSINRPIVIVASGKSLENNFSLLKKVRDKIFMISLSSANLALHENNIIPDLTFSTDPSYYSKLHLYNFNGVVAMPLTNSTNCDNNVLLLNQNGLLENELIKISSLPNIQINENGTVAGSALEFALNYSKEKIFLIGQDLESMDLNGHVSPYSFDNLLISKEQKNNPYYSIMYKRFINQGVSFQTYRDWFSEIACKQPNRIYRINSASKAIKGIEDINSDSFYKILNNIPSSTDYLIKTIESESLEIKRNNIRKLLNNYKKSILELEITENPLIYLISTAKYTDIYTKALSYDELELKINDIRDESIAFIEGLLQLYGRKFL